MSNFTRRWPYLYGRLDAGDGRPVGPFAGPTCVGRRLLDRPHPNDRFAAVVFGHGRGAHLCQFHHGGRDRRQRQYQNERHQRVVRRQHCTRVHALGVGSCRRRCL